jgi:Zn-dependent protease with chaperone function
MDMQSINSALLAAMLCAALIAPLTGHTKKNDSAVIPNPPAIGKDTARYNRHNLRNDFRNLETKCNGCGVRLVKHSKQAQRALSIVNRLLKSSNINQSFDVYSVNLGIQASAFTVGGSLIVVSDELVDRVTNDDQLAVVLGHEIAHSLAEHRLDHSYNKKRSGLNSGLMLLNIAVMAYTGVPLAGDVAESAAGKFGSGYLLKYKRAQEYEADQIGMLLMANAGFAPDSALELWKNADRLLGLNASGGFFSTHPTNKARLKKLEANLPLALRLINKTKYKQDPH